MQRGTVTATAYDTFDRVSQISVENWAELDYTYSNGNLSAITRTEDDDTVQTYSFTHDAFGNTLSASVGDRTLAAYEYEPGNGYLKKQTYGNGDEIIFTYDDLGRTKTVTYDDGTTVTYIYNGEGAVYSITEEQGTNTTLYLYTYDSIGRLIGCEKKVNGETILRTYQEFNEHNQQTHYGYQMGDVSYSESYTYNADGTLNQIVGSNGRTVTMGYDELRRLSTVTDGIANKTYTYRDITSGNTTTQVASLTYDLPTDQSYSYTYDNMGNIATYTDANGTVTYSYDAQNQLLSAVNGDTTYAYTYDTVGNILTGNGHTYTYGDSEWKDLLTKVDGQEIVYEIVELDRDNDGIIDGEGTVGNPISYYNGTRWTFGWSNGRQLITATAGDTNLSFTYDADGLRTSKTVDGIAHNYLYASGRLLRETYGSNTLDFFYDASGNAYALKYNGTLYYYITNLQGDVMSIVDAQGAVVGSYEYDPYGNVISATGTLAEINPIRYRGYYFDSESGLYYLQSRYYDPELGRFLNADSFASTGQGILGNNMFAYCNNTPIVSIDPTGHSLHHIFAYIFHEYSGGYSYIIDQTESEIGKKKLGVTTISHGGCGVVATYNALLSMGDYRSFDDVLAYYNEHFSRLTFGGLAGIMPGEVAQYFENNGYRTYMTDNPSEIDALSQTADACILWYMFPATYYPLGVKVDAFGAHFVEYSKEATAYIGRNTAEGSGTYYFTWPSDYGYKGQRYYAIGIFVYELGG